MRDYLVLIIVGLVCLVILQKGCKGFGERFHQRRQQNQENRRKAIDDRRQAIDNRRQDRKDKRQENKEKRKDRQFLPDGFFERRDHRFLPDGIFDGFRERRRA